MHAYHAAKVVLRKRLTIYYDQFRKYLFLPYSKYIFIHFFFRSWELRENLFPIILSYYTKQDFHGGYYAVLQTLKSDIDHERSYIIYPHTFIPKFCWSVRFTHVILARGSLSCFRSICHFLRTSTRSALHLSKRRELIRHILFINKNCSRFYTPVIIG